MLNIYLNQFDGGHLGFGSLLGFKSFFQNIFCSVFDLKLVLHVQIGNKHASRLKSTKCSSVTVLF